jgi:hypothetical protein
MVLGGPPPLVWEGERRGNAWKSFRELHGAADIVTSSEVELATRIADAVASCPVARPYLTGRHEVPVEWSTLGRTCRTRGIDVLGDGFITELKTANCTEPGRFRRAAMAMGYHAQLAWYRDAAASLGEMISDAYIVAVETKVPYAVTVMHLGHDALEEGAKLCRLWLERLLACEAVDEWPPYAQSVLEFEVEQDFNLVIDGEEIAA